jgi:hypothetical protein
MKNWMMWNSMLFIPLVLWGCSTAYTLHVADESSQVIYITHHKGTDVKVGDVFAVYKTVENGYNVGGGHSHGSSPYAERAQIATVKINKIIDEETAGVNIISGTVQNGATAEKLRGEKQLWSRRPPGIN